MTQAKFTAVAAMKDYKANPGSVFSENNIQALALLQDQEVSVYQSLRQAYIKAGIPVRKIEQMMASLDLTDDTPKYEERNGRLIYNKPTQYGLKAIPLCNFSARITEEITMDDGAESTIIYKIEAKTAHGAILPSVSISASEFPAMSWVATNYGARAIIEPGLSTRDQLRAAIMTLSGPIKRTVAYADTGWRKIDGNSVYLTVAGGISDDGLDASLNVNLSESLKAYDLKTPTHSLQDAFQGTLRFLALAPLKITMLLLAAIFRAPLAEMLAIDFSVFIVGRTGSFKSEIAALMQAHWGATFNRLSLPGSWTSTGNMLEKVAFWLKDVIFVIDDFLPGLSHLATNELHQRADRIIRGGGNHSGRGRMNADGSLRPTYMSRGLIVVTAEDGTKGASLNGRQAIIEVSKEEINLEILTELQAKAALGLFAATMYYFIKWLAPQMDDLRIFLRQRKDELRDEAVKVVKSHTRTPDLVASLMLGLEMFLFFGIENMAISEEEPLKLRAQGWDLLLAADEAQGEIQTEYDAVERFLSLLKATFMSGASHLENLSGGEPMMSHLWGWMETETNQGANKVVKPLGKMIGWADSANLYLLPDPAWEAVQTLATRQNNALTTTPITLRKRLAERTLIVVKDGKNVIQKSIRGVKHRVIQMPVTALYELTQGKPAQQNVSLPFSQPGAALLAALTEKPKPQAFAEVIPPFTPVPEREPEQFNPGYVWPDFSTSNSQAPVAVDDWEAPQSFPVALEDYKPLIPDIFAEAFVDEDNPFSDFDGSGPDDPIDKF